MHATAPCSAPALAQAHPTMYYIPLVNIRELQMFCELFAVKSTCMYECTYVSLSTFEGPCSEIADDSMVPTHTCISVTMYNIVHSTVITVGYIDTADEVPYSLGKNV